MSREDLVDVAFGSVALLNTLNSQSTYDLCGFSNLPSELSAQSVFEFCQLNEFRLFNTLYAASRYYSMKNPKTIFKSMPWLPCSCFRFDAAFPPNLINCTRCCTYSIVNEWMSLMVNGWRDTNSELAACCTCLHLSVYDFWHILL